MGQITHPPDPTRWTHFRWNEFVRDDRTPDVVLMRGWTVNHVPHTHEFGELVLVLEGGALHLTDSGPVPLRPGHAFLILPGQRHGYAETNHFLISNVLIHPELLAKLAPVQALAGFAPLRASADHPLPLEAATLAATLKQLDLIQEESFAGRDGARLLVAARLTELLVLLCRAALPGDGGADAARTRISRAVAWAENHYMQPLRPTQLAQAAALSPRHLRRCFQAALGVTPERFILETRIRHAARMLRSSHAPVGEVARRCGFADSNYFARAFRNLTGHPPGAHRISELRPQPQFQNREPESC